MLFSEAATHRNECTVARDYSLLFCKDCVFYKVGINCGCTKIVYITAIRRENGRAMLLNADNMCDEFKSKKLLHRWKRLIAKKELSDISYEKIREWLLGIGR